MSEGVPRAPRAANPLNAGIDKRYYGSGTYAIDQYGKERQYYQDRRQKIDPVLSDHKK